MLNFFIALLVVSCASKNDEAASSVSGTKEFAESLVSRVVPRWHTLAPDWAKLNDHELRQPQHMFWDVNPEIRKESATLNFIVVTPEDSTMKYGLDLVSGLHYVDGPYCEQKDSWNKVDFTIERPPFSIGIVPRVLDQLMMPQKIIVFGDEEYYQKHFKENFFDARVVGAYVEQICLDSTCQHDENWKSRLVLIGVQKNHPRYEDVQRPEDLKDLVDWKKVVAFIENGQGKNKIVKKFFPAFRMGALVDASQALHFIGRYSHVFTVSRMKDLKVNCYRLYDHMYSELGHHSALEKPAKSIEEVKNKSKRIKNKSSDKKFYQKFISFFKKFHKQLKTCSEYVYATNLQDDRDRHWFVTHIIAFTKMHQLGYAYDCNRKAWYPNPMMLNGKLADPVETQMRNCTASAIDRAFGAAVHELNRRFQANKSSYRYVDYDQGSRATHNRLYSWVESDGKVLSCQKYSEYKQAIRTFPSDIRWISRDTQGKTKTDLGDIIY